MNWLMALILTATMAFGGTAAAFHPVPNKYDVGKTQPFVGLVCKIQASAEHIFATWEEVGVLKAREVFTIYTNAGECFSTTTLEAYFIKQLDSMVAKDYRGLMQEVLLFSIAPTEESERVDYLVTWVPFGSVV